MKIGMGPVYSEVVGLPQHIFGIQKNSKHDITTIPPKIVRKGLGESRKRWRIAKKGMEISHLMNLFDIVHSHGDVWFTNMCRSAQKSGTKWVNTYHTMYFEEDYPDGCKPWQKDVNKAIIETASKADHLISISEWFKDYLHEKYSIDTSVIYNGYDAEACKKANKERFIDQFKLQDFVLFVGRNDPIKRPGIFIEQASKMPDVEFVMIGANLEKKQLIETYKMQIPKNLHLLGPQSHDVVLDAVAASGAFVMTSKREGIPTVLLEAMGLAKPSVVPNHSGCKEVLKSEEYGFLYDPESIDELVEKTYNALEAKKIGEKGKERAEAHFSWKALTKQIDSLYDSLMD